MESDVLEDDDVRGYRGLDIDDYDSPTNADDMTLIDDTALTEKISEVTIESLQKVIQE